MIITTLKENPHYKDQVLKEIEREFQYETDHSFNIDFYQLMKHENHANCHLLLDDKEELVSHIGVRPVTLHYKGVDIEVIFLGGIITRKKFQGRGHFKELYNYIIKRYQSQYALAILWSDHSKLYQKLGFSSFGLTAVLGETPVSSALIEQRGFFEASPMELKQIAHLYLESYSNTISVKRTPKDWSDISNITSSKFYIKRENNEISDYLFFEKGQDLKNIIHECSFVNNPRKMLAFDSLQVLSPFKLTDKNFYIHLAMGKVINSNLLCKFINVIALGKLKLQAKDSIFQLEVDSEVFHIPDSEILAVLFGPNQAQEVDGLLPPIYISGADSI